MESKKNNGVVVSIVILFILVIALGGYVVFDKLSSDKITANENVLNEVNTKKEEEKNVEEDDSKLTGECPLTKFDSGYVLTDSDKEEIMNSLESLDAGFTKNSIDSSTFKILNVSKSGYYIAVGFDTVPKTSGTYAAVTKVNGKFKVLMAGSADTEEAELTRDWTLERICK